MRTLLILVILSSLVYTAVPAEAQDRRTQERLRTLDAVRNTEREGDMSAREWAMRHRVPRRILQPDGALIELAAVHDGRPFYLVPLNARAAALTGTVEVQPGGRTGLGMTGRGLSIGIWDSGHVLSDHGELTGRVDFGDETDVSDHATHVAGTLAARGLDERARGMAYEAQLISYSWTNDATEMSNEAAAGLLLSNHSYGILAGWHYADLEDDGEQWYWLGDPGVSSEEDYMFGRYDVTAVQFDRVAHSHPHFLPVVAAGNDRADRGPRAGSYRAFNAQGDYQTYSIETRSIPSDGGSNGFDTIAGSGVAKNVLTVGSVGSSRSDLRTSSFSSFGPTDDGRVKPDLAGVGEGVYSLSSGGRRSYGVSSGTSMATATVTGSLLLLQQYYRDLFGASMRASTLKGLALHTAIDLGLPGPDYRTGWGLLDAEAAALQVQAAVDNSAAVIESELVEGRQFARDLVVDTFGEVRVTLSWTDPPGVRLPRSGPSSLDDATPHLRNDLDVRLIHHNTGNEYRPYVLDASDPNQPAVQGDNRVDPVEQVYVAAADTGAYTVVVTHKGILYGTPRQPFSLIVSGARGERAPVAISHLQAAASLDGVSLTWKTLFERRPGRFVVERGPGAAGKSAEDGFTRVGELAIDGSTPRKYSFDDDMTVAGVYAYRIWYEDGETTFLAGSAKVNLPAPETYAVLSSYPNPFADQATIVLDLPKTQHVTLEIYDAIGRRVAAAHDGELPAGRHEIAVRGDSWAPGAYFARVATPNGTVVHRLVKH